MKVVPIDLTDLSSKVIENIRHGQQFQVASREYGAFKSMAYRTDSGLLYFMTPDNIPVSIYYVDTLLYLNPIG